VERPLSPESETDGGDRRRRGGGGRSRRSDVTKPAPDHIDRYVPGQRDTAPRNGRRGGGRERDNRPRNAETGGRRSNARPRKTQEELDQEMEDYWGGKNDGPEAAGEQPVQDAPVVADAPAAPATMDNDIDMIE